MCPLSSSRLPGSATSVKLEEVLLFETSIAEDAWTLLQCFRPRPTFLFHRLIELLYHCNFPFPVRSVATSSSCFKGF